MEGKVVAVGYVRYSSHKQDSGLSLDVQKSVIEKCAKTMHCTVKIFEDPATSAKQYAAAKRKGMLDLVQYAKVHQPRYFLYADEDRLSRLGDDFVLDVYSEILQYAPSCELVNAQQERVIDPHELDGVLRFALSAEDNIKRSARAIDSQDTMLRAKKHPGQRPNFGYCYNREEHAMKLDDEKADIVRFIFHLAAWGYSFEFIAKTLNDSHIPSPTRKNWVKGSVHKIVRNPIYMGTPRWSLNVLSRIDQSTFQTSLMDAIGVEPTVSILTWHRANDLSYENKRARKLGSPYVFRDLLWCKWCKGHNKIGCVATKDYTPSYAEQPMRVYRCKSCGRHIDIETAHDELMNIINDEWYGRLFPQSRRVDKWFQQMSAKLEQNIRDLEHTQQWLKALKELRGHDEIALRKITTDLENTRELAAKVESFSRNPMQYYKTVERWRDLKFWGLSAIELRRFLIEVIDGIVYDFDGKTAPEVRYFPGPGICIMEADHREFTQNR